MNRKVLVALCLMGALCLCGLAGCSQPKSIITGDVSSVAEQCSKLSEGEEVTVVVTGIADDATYSKGYSMLPASDGYLSMVDMIDDSGSSYYGITAFVYRELTSEEITEITSGVFTIDGTYKATLNDGLHDTSSASSTKSFSLSDCDVSSGDSAGKLVGLLSVVSVLTFEVVVGLPILAIVVVVCFVRKRQGKAKHPGLVIGLAVFETLMLAMTLSGVASWYLCLILAIAAALLFYVKVSLGSKKDTPTAGKHAGES